MTSGKYWTQCGLRILALSCCLRAAHHRAQNYIRTQQCHGVRTAGWRGNDASCTSRGRVCWRLFPISRKRLEIIRIAVRAFFSVFVWRVPHPVWLLFPIPRRNFDRCAGKRTNFRGWGILQRTLVFPSTAARCHGHFARICAQQNSEHAQRREAQGGGFPFCRNQGLAAALPVIPGAGQLRSLAFFARCLLQKSRLCTSRLV